MGGGASTSKTRDSDEVASKLFDSIDTNKDGQLSLVEVFYAVQSHGKNTQAKWTIDKIKQTLTRHDIDGNGYIDREEFTAVMAELVKPEKGAKGKGGKKARRAKKGTPKEQVPEASAPTKAPQDEEAPPWASSDEFREQSMKKSNMSPSTIDLQRTSFWAKQDEQKWWKVPMTRDLSQMPWLDDNETCLTSAIGRARSLGRTPLLVDMSRNKAVDALYTRLGAQMLDAKKMVVDHQQEVKTLAVLMREARKQLVCAMQTGRPFYIRLTDSKLDFMNGVYVDDVSLPLSVFDHAVVKALNPYTGNERGVLDLYSSSSHPWRKVLRDLDLDPVTANFHVAPGFEVVVCSHVEKEDYIGDLTKCLPASKMQLIQLVEGHLL